MTPKVVIIGHGYLSRLSLVRSVAEIGCEVLVIPDGDDVVTIPRTEGISSTLLREYIKIK